MLILISLTLLTACSDPAAPSPNAMPDSNMMDAASDAETTDALPMDSASADASEPDASFPDASFPDASIPDAAFDALPDVGLPEAGVSDCDSLKAAYDALVGPVGARCTAPTECMVVRGHCTSGGLGGCYHAVSGSVTQMVLDELNRVYRSMGCSSGSTCRCPSPPSGATCTAGGCTLVR